MNIEEAKKKLLEPKKIPLVEIIRKFKREGIENFVITRPEIVETLLTAYEKEKERNKELESDIQQKNFEIKCLNSDIKNMYCEEGVIAILEDNFDLSREEAIQILEEE